MGGRWENGRDSKRIFKDIKGFVVKFDMEASLVFGIGVYFLVFRGVL